MRQYIIFLTIQRSNRLMKWLPKDTCLLRCVLTTNVQRFYRNCFTSQIDDGRRSVFHAGICEINRFQFKEMTLLFWWIHTVRHRDRQKMGCTELCGVFILQGDRCQNKLPLGSVLIYYRPQQSCGKVMFLNLSVILFTGGGLCPGVSLSGGLSVRGGGLCQGDPTCTVTCGRYASYWNAFLLVCVSVSISVCAV